MLTPNEQYFLKSIIISNFARLRFPFKLSYAVTYRCNLRCKMCNIWKKGPQPDELNIKEIEMFFMNANKFSWIGITGGEPFLRAELPDIADIIIKHCERLCALHFATNGQLTDRIISFSECLREKYRKLKIIFTISIDGPPVLHDRIRGVEGAWDKAVSTFIRLKRMPSIKAQINFTVSSHNLDKFEETFSILKDVYPDIRFDDININIFQKSSFYYENQQMQEPDTGDLLKMIKQILQKDNDRASFNNFLRRQYLKLYPKYIGKKKSPLRCKALSSTCFLDPCGNLFPCAVYNRKLINIRNLGTGFGNLWSGYEAKKISRECFCNICPGCWSPCDAFSAIAGSLAKLWLV